MKKHFINIRFPIEEYFSWIYLFYLYYLSVHRDLKVSLSLLKTMYVNL